MIGNSGSVSQTTLFKSGLVLPCPFLSLCGWDRKDENDMINGVDIPDGATKLTSKRVTD